ncbi:SseB family protein [Motilibacter deserti]|uniref:SseB family protein n=1 Tax=Motilibacter deserti TaxID=2714956 RepID=A0ABX0GU32_9ACTN|nr:SseB family protein [Motilibacter deserti]
MSGHGGKTIPDTGFAGDEGVADAAVTAALAAYAADPGRAPEVLTALAASRLLVPVVAVLAEEEDVAAGQLRREKRTDMALVTVEGPGGRALPVFTSLETLARWRADARPVPVEPSRAAVAGAAEGAQALLVDPAGPVPYVVAGPALRALAEERVPLPMYADPEVIAAVQALVAAEPDVTAVLLAPAEGVDARIVLTVRAGAALEPVVQRLGRALQGERVLRERTLRGVDVAVETA